MKKSVSTISLILFLFVVLFSCNQKGSTQKEQPANANQSLPNTKSIDSTGLKQTTEVKVEKYNFKLHNDVDVFWKDFKEAILTKDKETLSKMCVNPIPSYYYDSKSIMGIDRFFEPEFVKQIAKIQKLDKTKASVIDFIIKTYAIKKGVPVYQLTIDGWEYSGACLYFTLIDGAYTLVGVDSWENEG